MRKVPVGGASIRRARAWVLTAAILLAACDASPFLVDHDQAVGTADRTDVPVETVTAIEVDVDDLMIDGPSEASSTATGTP
jgi:hypothetical protein